MRPSSFLPLALAVALLTTGFPARASASVTGGSSLAVRGAVAAAATSTVKAPRSVQVGTAFTVKGKVPMRGKQRRVVKVTLNATKVAQTRTAKSGKFAVRVVAGSVPGVAKYVISAPKTKTLKAFRRTATVTVVAAPITAVTSVWPAATISVPLGQDIPVSGSVTGSQPAGRTVVVQQFFGGAWLDRVSTTSAADGTYATALPGSWLFSAPARVLVKAAGAAPEAAAPQVVATVRPTWVPGGSASSWVPVYENYPIRLNPCETVEYSANLAQAPALARDALNDALASVTQATGITFVNVGDSAGVGRPEPGFTGIPANADLLISWVHDSQTTASQPSTNGGVAIHDTIANGSDAFGPTYVAKKSAVNMNVDYRGGWNRTLMTHVYRHEIGHIIGLGHPSAEDQVMGAGEAASTNFAWGAGDLAAFARFGLQGGCVTG